MGQVGCRVALFVVVICPGNFSLFAEDAAGKPLEVETVLKNWHERISQYQGVKGTFVRTVYDKVFEMQKLSKGTFNVNRSGEAVYCWSGYKPENPCLKTGNDGSSCKAFPDNDEAWYWVNGVITRINESEKTYDQIKKPKEVSDEPIAWLFGLKIYPSFWTEFWLSRPYLLGMPPEELQKRFDVSILKQTEQHVWLRLQPKTSSDLANFSEASLILDLKTYLPYALKMVDPPETKVTVHLFKDVEGIKELERIPQPDLTGYKSSVIYWDAKPRKLKKKTHVLVESEGDQWGTPYIAPLSMGKTSGSEW